MLFLLVDSHLDDASPAGESCRTRLSIDGKSRASEADVHFRLSSRALLEPPLRAPVVAHHHAGLLFSTRTQDRATTYFKALL